MIHTKQVIKIFEDFSIFMVFEFLNTLKNRTRKIKSITTRAKFVKEKCYIQKEMHDMIHEPMILNIGIIDAWIKEIIMHEYPSSPTRHVHLG